MDPNEEIDPPPAKYVGKGLGSPDPNNQQWWLAGSLHPYAPFVGNALQWQSYAYDDGTTYEGLMMLDVPHGKGVLVFGNGVGGGIQKANRADRYEGEFDSGFAHGMGQYTNTVSNKVYKGEYKAGMRHGCGMEYDMAPFIKLVEKGMDPDAAWAEVGPQIEKGARKGTWLKDTFFTGPDDSGRWCHIAEIMGTAEEVDSVVAKARMFQYKPDGEVTFRFAQDENGLPAPLMQDPLHYPHGTKFLAPGPMGQCHPIPDDDNVKAAMVRAAEAHRRIYEQFNLPYSPEPGSVLEKATKHWNKLQARKRREQRKKELRDQQLVRRLEAQAAAEAGKAAPPPTEEPEEGEEGEDEGGISDDDLIACTVGIAAEQQAREQERQQRGPAAAASGLLQPPTVLASVSLGMTRAAAAVHAAFRRAAITAPKRRSLTRPSHLAGQRE